MSFYAQRLGDKTSVTPEGFLVCHDVPLARVGEMLYRAGEVPVDAGPDGIITISRDADTLFHPDAIASYNGKAVVNDHPPEGKVTPQNYKRYTVGNVQNPRRGQGADSDCLMGDLLIKDAQAIADVLAGKREVSNGYDADYETLAPGRGMQRNIYGNHVAIVMRGRCGTRCSIGDQYMTTDTSAPAAKPATTGLAFIRKLLGATTDAEANQVIADAERAEADAARATSDAATTSALAKLTADVAAMSTAITALVAGGATTADKASKEAKEEDDEDGDEEKAKTKDAAAFADAAPRFEVLKPGFTIPTVDATATSAAMRERLHACKCQALDAAYATEAGKKAIQPFIGAAQGGFANLPAATVDAAFIGASELIKAQNNGLTVDAATKVRSAKDFGRTVDAAAINAANADFWNNNGGNASTGAR